MNLMSVLIRTVFFYFFILFIYRIMGKREIGQLSIEDLAVSILIAEMVAISIENENESLLFTILPILILVVLEILMAYISLKSNKFRHFIAGKPSVIISNGKINFKEMIKQRYSLDDLLIELRIKGIKDILMVEHAILENNGKLSIFKYGEEESPLPLVLDGTIIEDTLKIIKKDIKWVYDCLGDNISDIFYAFYRNGKVYTIYKKDAMKESF